LFDELPAERADIRKIKGSDSAHRRASFRQESEIDLFADAQLLWWRPSEQANEKGDIDA
jgi:hypothetical protein